VSAYVTGAAISATSAALGYGANALRERGARKEAAKAARSAELRQAMREYLAALDASILEAEDFPVPPRVTKIDRWVEKEVRGTVVEFFGHIVVRLLKRVVYGRRHNDLSDRLVAASAHLRLVSTPRIEELLLEVDTLVKEKEQDGGDEQWKQKWREFRSRMRECFREELEKSSAS
jgi:hypothetical protein